MLTIPRIFTGTLLWERSLTMWYSDFPGTHTFLELAEKLDFGALFEGARLHRLRKKVLVCEDLYQGTSLLVP